MRWSQLLFAHWPLDPDRLQPLVHPDVRIDTHDNAAWLGVIPFRMTRIRLRGLPPIPGADRFPELNVRTYVRYKNQPAVWFFSLDAASLPAVAAARGWYRLNYRWARMRVTIEPAADNQPGPTVHYRSRRRRGDAALDATYRPIGDPIDKAADPLATFLTERYQLLTTGRRGRLLRARVHHAPWTLHPAEADLRVNTMADPLGLRLAEIPPHLMYAAPVHVYAAPPCPARTSAP
jgi:hypothetical protein